MGISFGDSVEAEEARIRKLLIQDYGKPIFVSETWEAFDGYRVMLRKDKPEILMIDEALVPLYREQIQGGHSE